MLLAVTVAAIGGTVFTTSSVTVDADDINKGIGKTEVWEPGPTDGFTPTEMPFRENQDANELPSYANAKASIAIPENAAILSSKELDRTLDELRQSGLPTVMSAIDYKRGLLVIWTPDVTIRDQYREQLGNVPFVLLYEEAPPRWYHEGPVPEVDPKLDLQNFILPSAYAEGTAGTQTYYGTKVTDNNNADGIYARVEIHDSGVTIDSGNTLYGPAISMADKGRLEIVVEYNDDSTHKLRVWDHGASPEEFIYTKIIDSSYMSKYANTVGSDDFSYVKVEVNGSGSWTAYLWDVADSHWDILIQKTGGSGDLEIGWAIWEAFYFAAADCADTTIPEIITADVQVRNSGSWSYATSSHASAFSATPLDCATGSWNTNYHDWDVS